MIVAEHCPVTSASTGAQMNARPAKAMVNRRALSPDSIAESIPSRKMNALPSSGLLLTGLSARSRSIMARTPGKPEVSPT